MTDKQRGGARPGCGRPPLEDKVETTVTITKRHLAIAKRLGKEATGGENVSAGVRVALDKAEKP